MFLTALLFNFKRITLKSGVLMGVAAFTFGSIYYQAIFPISMFLTLALLALYGYKTNRLWLMIVGSMAASFTYSTGFLLPVALGIGILLTKDRPVRARVKRAALINGLGALTVLFYFAILQIEVGDWQAFIKVQSVYGHGIESPIKRIGHRIEEMPRPVFQLANVPHLQSGLVLAGYLLLSFFFWTKKVLRTPFLIMLYAYVSLYILFPWTVGGNLSMYRAESLLLPSVFFLAKVKTRYTIAYLLILMAVWLPMSYLFFTNVLV